MDQLETLDQEEVLVDLDRMVPKEDKDQRDCLDRLVALDRLESQALL